jgi:hypothetical protein
MSVPAVVWLTVGLVSMVILAAVFIGLFRQFQRLASAVGELNKQLQPVLLEMQKETEKARERAERLQASEIQVPRRGRR